MKDSMSSTKFGVEVEMTGITRSKAAKVLACHFGSEVTTHSHLDEHSVADRTGRTWKIVSDGSISAERILNGSRQSTTNSYCVELVTPILTYYEDIDTLQEIIRELRDAGAFPNASTGIHIHLDGANHTYKSLHNFINLIASRDDLLYDALKIPASRQRWCKKLDENLVQRLRSHQPHSLSDIETAWYECNGCYGSHANHYNSSRYHFLNLHSFFQPGGNHTVELRGFNFTSKSRQGSELILHAGELRAYIVLALALNAQALSQRSASPVPPQTENQRFAMRTWLNRIGFIGDEFKSCRKHLTRWLKGNAAWRFRDVA